MDFNYKSSCRDQPFQQHCYSQYTTYPEIHGQPTSFLQANKSVSQVWCFRCTKLKLLYQIDSLDAALLPYLIHQLGYGTCFYIFICFQACYIACHLKAPIIKV